MRVDASPVFDLGEEVALFLSRMCGFPPDRIEPVDYYRVTGAMQGKLGYIGDNLINIGGEAFTISEIEQKIAEIRNAEGEN